jgi:hypothetical protein
MAVLIAIVCVSNIVCLIVGAKIGQTTKKGEKVELPNINPMKAIRETQARKEVEKKQDKLETILRNIERYDGTSRGQEEVK